VCNHHAISWDDLQLDEGRWALEVEDTHVQLSHRRGELWEEWQQWIDEARRRATCDR
jgi:hypothetical protein